MIKTLILTIKKVKNWPVLIADYFGVLLKDKAFVKFRDGLNVEFRPCTTDRGIIQEVLLHECYKYDTDENATVIDIGAQAGYFSSYALMQGAKKVIAFEPVDENFKIAEKNMSNATKVSNIKYQDYYLYSTAVVGSNINDLKIYIDNENSGGHSAFEKTENFVVVPTDNINNIIDGLLKVDVLKCDCEGGEYDIFFNIKPENFSKISTMIIEVHPISEGLMPKDLIKHLEKNGFNIHTDSKDLTKLCVVHAWKS